VRILVYGQSNSEQPWWQMVRAWLEAQYPNGHLVMEEHARGGCSAQCLIGREPWFLDGQTRNRVPEDVFAWKPDLIIFSVYGRHDDFETLVRGFRNGCSAFADHEVATARCRGDASYPDYRPAELLLQSYYRDDDRPDSGALPALPPIPEGHYDAWMARVWIPGVARKYGAVWQPLWEQWGDHLEAHHLRAADLLPDGENLTEAGNALMARLVEAFLCVRATQQGVPSL
jgi:hypothetical protein